MKNYNTLSCENGDSEIFKTDKKRKISFVESGLTVFSTFVFIVGEMAGSGILALPKAVVNCGWIGVILLPIICFNAGYSGVKLGNCWEIVEDLFPKYKGQNRNPYPTIAGVAVGRWGSELVSHCIKITLFGAGTVNLLLAAQMFQQIFEIFLPSISSCLYFLLICFGCSFPMWLGSPKHFSFVGFAAVITTALSCTFFFIQMLVDSENIGDYIVEHKQHGFQDFFLGFGALMFAFGGASTFPTIQNDMLDKSKFGISVVLAFSVVLLFYFPISVGGYLIYGEYVSDNIAISLGKSGLVTFGNILMAVHLIFAFLIVINPVCQDLEETFNISKDFGLGRCLVRSFLMLGILAVGETIPKFGKILSLVGGSTITLLTFVFPPYFYMKLCDRKIADSAYKYREITLHERIYLWELIVIGIIGGACSTYSAIKSIVGDSLIVPCY